jgi:putative aldouronate transport system substrate-binding protein
MKKFWKIMSLMLVVLMTLSLAACDSNQVSVSATPSPSASTESAAPTSQAPAYDPMQPYDVSGPYPETVELTFARHLNRGGTMGEGETTSDNVMIDVIKSKLNVQCKVAWETSPDQYNNRLSLALASDTLPDVFLISSDNYVLLPSLVEGGQLADLTEAYNKCIGGTAAEYLKSYNGQHLTAATFDGKIMAIPGPMGGYNHNLLWIRSDWLKKLNLELPKTVDDIKNIALKFKEAKLGGENTIGLVVDPVKPVGQSGDFLSLGIVANSQGAYPRTWITGADGKVIYGSIAPEMKTTLGILADWYKSGVLDPQWMTYQNMDAVTPAVRNGQCGMYFGGWWSPWTVNTAVYDSTDGMEWVPAMAPLAADGKYHHLNPTDPGSFIVVSSKCKNPEAVIRANNVEFDLVNGFFNEDPEFKDAIQASKDASGFGRTISPFSGASLAEKFDKSVLLGMAIAEYAQKGGELKLPDFATPDYYDQAKTSRDFVLGNIPKENNKDKWTFAYGLYTSYADNHMMYDPEMNVIQPVAYSYTTPAMADYLSSLQTMETQMIVSIISGEQPIEYFDEFVASWKSSGGDIITDEVQAVVEAQK